MSQHTGHNKVRADKTDTSPNIRIKDALKVVLNDRERKNIFKIGAEALHCLVLEKEVPFYYFTSLLYQRDSGDYRNYIGHKKIQRIDREIFHQGGDHEALEDKYKFRSILLEHEVPTTTLLASTQGFTATTPEKQLSIPNRAALEALAVALTRKASTEAVFVKPTSGIGGKHTFKLIEPISYGQIDTIFKLLTTENFLFEENIAQHRSLNRIYDGSINTLRVITHVEHSLRKVHLLSAYLRVGAGGSIVDNTSSRGFRVPVDLESWKLRGSGKSLFQSGAHTITHHPDSGVQLDGIALPFAREIKELVSKVAGLFDKSIVGWDIAITTEGPIVIEGNQNPHLIGAQIASRGIKNDQGFRRALSAYL